MNIGHIHLFATGPFDSRILFAAVATYPMTSIHATRNDDADNDQWKKCHEYVTHCGHRLTIIFATIVVIVGVKIAFLIRKNLKTFFGHIAPSALTIGQTNFLLGIIARFRRWIRKLPPNKMETKKGDPKHHQNCKIFTYAQI